MKIVMATRNSGKIAEITEKFRGLPGVELVPLSSFHTTSEVEEDGTTFQENALKKALATARATGLPALSDDSGLVVDALGGRPGVLSARYGGEGLSDGDRNRLLLREMKGIMERSARFMAVIVLAFPDGGYRVAQGICEGEISHEPRGTMGFGYDPVFYLPQYQKSMAELTLEEKNRISHRGAALERMREILEGMPGTFIR